jgi:hypothetical protein
MSSDAKKPRDARALWKTIHEQAALDEFDAIAEMSDDELDAAIEADGGDPRSIREGGAALARELLERRRALDWHRSMESKLDALREAHGAARSKPSLSRAELLASIERARRHPRFASGAAMQFHKKSLEACTDDELAALLEELELLAKLAGERDDE